MNALKAEFPDIKHPTQIQKNLLSLLKSDLSVLAASPPGTGKSLATALFLLSHTPDKLLQSDTPSISNLLIVPTPDLASQYYNIIKKLTSKSGINENQVVQCIYRADAESERKQIELLKKYPAPHVLIGTPTRILDILSSPNLKLLPLFNLSFIAVDEADRLLPKICLYSSFEKNNKFVAKDFKHSVPTQVLLNFLVPWRDNYVSANNDYFFPLRFLLESSTASNNLKLICSKNNWIKGRTMLRLGTDKVGGEMRERIANDVSSYFVSFNPQTGILTDTNFDISNIIPEFDDKAFDIIGEMNDRRKKDYMRKFSKLSKDGKTNLLKLYAIALARTIELDFEKSKETFKRRSLVIIPEGYSIDYFLEILKKHTGITGARSRIIDNKCAIFYNKSENELAEIDPETFFSTKINPDKPNDELPQVLVYRASECVGLDFPDLSRIYVLSWDSILSSKLYLSLAGRCRVAPIDERGEKSQTGSWKEPTDPEQGRCVVISTTDELNDDKYRALLIGSMKKIAVNNSKYFS